MSTKPLAGCLSSILIVAVLTLSGCASGDMKSMNNSMDKSMSNDKSMMDDSKKPMKDDMDMKKDMDNHM